MSDYFRPWRRNVGCVTLVMACIAMAGWLRSMACMDVLWVQGLGHYYELILTEGMVHWINREGLWNFDFDWTNWPVDSSYAKKDIVDFLIRSKSFARKPENHAIVWTIPILPLAIPLTVASVCLLLFKPRPSTPKKIPEPIATEGATS